MDAGSGWISKVDWLEWPVQARALTPTWQKQTHWRSVKRKNSSASRSLAWRRTWPASRIGKAGVVRVSN